ncbi:3-phosphoserine/phosphohydroxythreonine transaminase [Paenibacillus mucilaginosus]|uniref:3-phosphoserine/phosphohydroxythreonine transaminase n=1 Tax=Paenibacillus mucilaginosus TaxID=61624 RepID=UPI00030FE8F9|nr:3-phosphoserine/phosphohydroxythreonine transaminase [Paenibacillus mucilaginosus]MCG7212887.1 3-phosphoserine/phosphohydroxythreonine transaminase [Paenibacillus mucilaginosus]WDM26695.1 3-phosphoserine/phosphohydroxythreonine transaminase [Paenibacillus mucilaginosus]
MTRRAYNFNAGPAALPLEVLQQAQETFVDYNGIGMSLMEISHRSKEYEALNAETASLLLELLGIQSGYQVLFLGGGASMQFAQIPLNFLKPGTVGNYIITGSFSEKAYQEAQIVGEASIAASNKEGKWRSLPKASEIVIDPKSSYVHMTTNNTIEGSQWSDIPDTGGIPLIGDMTSGILSRPIDASKFGMIYAGAQKNLGPSGVTVAVIRDDLLAEEPKHLPVMLRYTTHAKNQSLYNTPPVHSIYMVNLVLKWVKEQGGVEAMEKRNVEKSKLLYDVIDASGGFYSGNIDADSRSIMNVTFRLPSEELEKQFVKESKDHNFVGLAGHRSVGGIRASAYNAVPHEACQALAEFMKDFQQRNS